MFFLPDTFIHSSAQFCLQEIVFFLFFFMCVLFKNIMISSGRRNHIPAGAVLRILHTHTPPPERDSEKDLSTKCFFGRGSHQGNGEMRLREQRKLSRLLLNILSLWPAGSQSCWDLRGLCRTHFRGKPPKGQEAGCLSSTSKSSLADRCSYDYLLPQRLQSKPCSGRQVPQAESQVLTEDASGMNGLRTNSIQVGSVPMTVGFAVTKSWIQSLIQLTVRFWQVCSLSQPHFPPL